MNCVESNKVKLTEWIRCSCERVGKSPEDVTIVCVTKKADLSDIKDAINSGLTHLGENRLQSAVNKCRYFSGESLTWHFIGHLQKNKVRETVRLFDMIQSVDRVDLAKHINASAAEEHRVIDILLQVNIGSEAQKHGFTEKGLMESLRELPAMKHIRVRGLMAMAPFFEDREETRPYFRKMKALFEEVKTRAETFARMDYLSMGMSHDFQVAIEEGSNMVRIGTLLFERAG